MYYVKCLNNYLTPNKIDCVPICLRLLPQNDFNKAVNDSDLLFALRVFYLIFNN